MTSKKKGSLRDFADAGVAQRRAEEEAKAEEKRAQNEKNLSWVEKERRRVSRLLGTKFPAQGDPVVFWEAHEPPRLFAITTGLGGGVILFYVAVVLYAMHSASDIRSNLVPVLMLAALAAMIAMIAMMVFIHRRLKSWMARRFFQQLRSTPYRFDLDAYVVALSGLHDDMKLAVRLELGSRVSSADRATIADAVRVVSPKATQEWLGEQLLILVSPSLNCLRPVVGEPSRQDNSGLCRWFRELNENVLPLIHREFSITQVQCKNRNSYPS